MKFLSIDTPFLAKAACAAAALMLAATCLTGCGDSADETSGATFKMPEHVEAASFNADAAETSGACSIDTSSVASGYVGASAQASSRLKFLVVCGDATMSYDLPQDSTPIVCPLSLGDGAYQFRIMQNTSGENYVELFSATADVKLSSEFEPFLRPSVYCNFDDESAATAQARKLAKGAKTQAEAVEDVCDWIVKNISYDDAKAAELKDASGYTPDPDSTLKSKKGVCFDYASLGAAMLRALGIPTKIVTGNVSPDGIYHAWIMVYIDGTWKSAQFDVEPKTWSRVDLTFAASGDDKNVGDGKEYTDRYVY